MPKKEAGGLAWEKTSPGKMLTVLPHRAGYHIRDRMWVDPLWEQELGEAAVMDGRTPLPTVQAAGDGRWASQAEGVSSEHRLCPALPPEGMEESPVDGKPTLGRGGKL